MGNIARVGANNTVVKPQIYLHGETINNGIASIFSERVDNAKHLNSVTTTSINGRTILDKDNLLTFNGSVRVIITGQMSPKPSYQRQSGVLGSLEFEGNTTFDTTDSQDLVNYYAETWYTLNGKDPIRTAAKIYNFLDMDAINESNPSGDPGENLAKLGFVLRTNPTGSNLVTLKAKTYYRNEESRIAVVVFKIARIQGSREFYQPPR